MNTRHLKVSKGRVLCGKTGIYSHEFIRERTWVTCPACQRIIIEAHPGVDPATLFAHPPRL
jgi:ribosomal protein S27E